MSREAYAWDEGYWTALRDFGVEVTEDSYRRCATRNPLTYPEGRRRLSPFEVQEIRQALGYHFDDCATAEFEDQATIIESVVERILARRPERGA